MKNTSKISVSSTAGQGQKIDPRGTRQIGRSLPAVGKSEKRRQQNRNSQIAFRQRNKMTLMALQEELNQSLLVNDALYDTIEGLLEKTETLKRSIEDALASRLKRSRSVSLNSPRSYSSCFELNRDGKSGQDNWREGFFLTKLWPYLVRRCSTEGLSRFHSWVAVSCTTRKVQYGLEESDRYICSCHHKIIFHCILHFPQFLLLWRHVLPSPIVPTRLYRSPSYSGFWIMGFWYPTNPKSTADWSEWDSRQEMWYLRSMLKRECWWGLGIPTLLGKNGGAEQE